MAWPKWTETNSKRPSVDEAKKRLTLLVESPAYLNIKRQATKEDQDKAINEAGELREVIAGQREWLS